MRFFKKQKNNLKSLMAAFLAFLMVFGALPIDVMANVFYDTVAVGHEVQAAPEPEPFYAIFMNEEVLVPADGVLHVDFEGIDVPVPMNIPRYLMFDGQRLYAHEFYNISPMFAHAGPADDLPIAALAAGITPASATATPPVPMAAILQGIVPMPEKLANMEAAAQEFAAFSALSDGIMALSDDYISITPFFSLPTTMIVTVNLMLGDMQDRLLYGCPVGLHGLQIRHTRILRHSCRYSSLHRRKPRCNLSM